MSGKNSPVPIDTDDYRSMRVLEEIEKNPNVSQRELASSVGVALGIANSLVHALVRKGLVKIRGDNNRTISYHVTKKGLGHKATLAMQWTANTIDFYRQARQSVSASLAGIGDKAGKRIVLLGANEVTEIAIIVAAEAGVDIVGVVRHEGTYLGGDSLLGVAVGGPGIAVDNSADAAVMCLDRSKPEYAEMFDEFAGAVTEVPVFTSMGEPLHAGR